MAQTRRKRQTKHRGNAAGQIESRGRTGRPLSADEKKRPADKNQRREERLNRKPTWRSSAQRALFAGVFIFVILLLLDKHKKGSGSPVVTSLLFAVLATLFYVIAGFYFETFMWRRRMAKKQQAKSR